MTGSDFILNALAQEGLTHLFLVPGGLIDPFLPALARHPQLHPIVAAHEGGAAYMADGYARASGRFGAALGIGGPGLCNMATAVARGFTVDDPAQLEPTYRSAFAANATVLIDVKADKSCATPVYDFAAGARAWSYHE